VLLSVIMCYCVLSCVIVCYHVLLSVIMCPYGPPGGGGILVLQVVLLQRVSADRDGYEISEWTRTARTAFRMCFPAEMKRKGCDFPILKKATCTLFLQT
jgi:hypothetical protein